MSNAPSLKGRVERLEEEVAPHGVAGIVTARGGPHDPAEEARVRARIEELHRKGHQVVYVANLAGRQQ